MGLRPAEGDKNSCHPGRSEHLASEMLAKWRDLRFRGSGLWSDPKSETLRKLTGERGHNGIPRVTVLRCKPGTPILILL